MKNRKNFETITRICGKFWTEDLFLGSARCLILTGIKFSCPRSPLEFTWINFSCPPKTISAPPPPPVTLSWRRACQDMRICEKKLLIALLSYNTDCFSIQKTACFSTSMFLLVLICQLKLSLYFQLCFGYMEERSVLVPPPNQNTTVDIWQTIQIQSWWQSTTD